MPRSDNPRVALGPGSRSASLHSPGTRDRCVPDERARSASEDPGPRATALQSPFAIVPHSQGAAGAETPQLVCVPPDRAAAVWPHVRALIHAAMKRGELSSLRPVEASVLAGDALLWLAWDPGAERITAAAVTELHETEWRKVCVLVACGGAGVNRWIALLDGIEAYARAAGCVAVRIMGRKGWMRLLGDYRVKRIVLEKDL